MTAADPAGLSQRFNEDGNAAVDPLSAEGIERVLETIRWGASLGDRMRIGAYYTLRIATRSLRRDRDLVSGMYPKYWLGDVTVNSPIGRFICRSRTIDFDIVNPNYEAAEVAAFQRRLTRDATTPVVCFDVGAHIGKFSILAARTLGDRGRVYSFEPEPSNYASLLRNIRLNELSNVTAFNVACGGRDSAGSLSRSVTNIGAHTLVAREGAEQIPVQVRSLDSVAREENIPRVDVIKLDVEYLEAEVLAGARTVLESSPDVAVFFEETDSSGNAGSVRFLRGIGFEVSRLAKNTYAAARPNPRRSAAEGPPEEDRPNGKSLLPGTQG